MGTRRRIAAGLALRFATISALWAPAPALCADQAPPTADGELPRDSSLDETLLRERSFRVSVEHVAAAIADGDHDRAIAIGQSVLDADSDAFCQRHGRIVSAHAAVLEMLRDLPGSARLGYERRYGTDADLLWNRFLTDRDDATLRALLRRFSLTSAGAAALRHCISRAFDVGDFQSAVAFGRRLAADPHHADRVAPGDWLRIHAAARITDAPWPELRSRPQADGIDDSIPQRIAAAAADAPAAAVSVPSPEPMWSATYFEDDAHAGPLQLVSYESPRAATRAVYESWASQRASESLTCAAANRPLVVAGVVVTRDFSHVVARELDSGRVLWRFECAESVKRALAELAEVDDGTTGRGREAAATTCGQLFEALFAGNSVYGQLSSDGEFVFFVDALPDPSPEQRLCNRIVAVGLHSQGSVGWSAPADADSGAFTFLGRPVVAGRELLVIAECCDEMQLVALSRDSGTIVWRQPICWPRFPLADDTRRLRRTCVPAIAGGFVVCPTGQGLLVGVDMLTGTLSWVYSCGDEGSGYRAGRWQRTPNCDRTDAAFESGPLIVGGSVVFLPSESQSVHCIELSTGRPLWKIDRNGARYVEATSAEAILLVGETHCASVAIGDGSQRWDVETGAPVGRGVCANDEYLLPTENGIVAIQHATGQVRHIAASGAGRHVTVMRAGGVLPEPAAPPATGNFAVADDVVVVTSPTGLSVFRQADSALRQISARNYGDLDAEDVLAAADLELRLGRPQRALERLDALVEDRDEPGMRARAEERIREVLFHEIASGHGNDAMLQQLGRLAQTREDRARHLLYRAAVELEAHDLDALMTTALALIAVDCRTTVPLDAQGRHRVLPLQHLATLTGKLPADRRLADGFTDECRRVLAAAGDDQRTRLLRFCLNNAGCCESSLELARELIESGDSQTAELLLLGLPRTTDDASRMRASSQLVGLWSQHGLGAEARLLSPSPQGSIPAVERVSIDVVPTDVNDSETALLGEVFDGNRRFSRDTGASLTLWDRGLHGTNPRQAHLAVVDAARGRQIATIKLSDKTWRPGRLDRYDAGHVIPIASDVVHGISLLSASEIWTFADSAQSRETPRIGPFGPTFCAIQTGTTLTVLDPANGEVLWQRTDLGHDSGLYADESIGMLGDEQAILVFDQDETGYRLYDTRSGVLMRQDRLDIEPRDRRRPRHAFGRRLLYVTSVGGKPHFRLWDPLENVILATGLVGDRFSVAVCEKSESAVIVNGDRLEIRDAASGQTRWSGLLDAADTAELRSIDAWCDNGTWCIHLARNLEDSQYRTAGNEVGVPHVLMRGDLLVIDQSTGERWQRTLPPCNLLRLPQYRLPIFVGISRVKDSQPDDESRLAVHVISRITGEILLSRDDLRKNELMMTRFDEQAGVLELCGKDASIRLQLR